MFSSFETKCMCYPPKNDDFSPNFNSYPAESTKVLTNIQSCSREPSCKSPTEICFLEQNRMFTAGLSNSKVVTQHFGSSVIFT